MRPEVSPSLSDQLHTEALVLHQEKSSVLCTDTKAPEVNGPSHLPGGKAGSSGSQCRHAATAPSPQGPAPTLCWNAFWALTLEPRAVSVVSLGPASLVMRAQCPTGIQTCDCFYLVVKSAQIRLTQLTKIFLVHNYINHLTTDLCLSWKIKTEQNKQSMR